MKKTKILIEKLPFTFHMLVGLMYNSTKAKKKKKNSQGLKVMPSKKASELVMEKIGKSWFLKKL